MYSYKYIFFDVADTLLYKQGLHDNIAGVLAESDIHIDVVTIRRQHKMISEIIAFPIKTSRAFYQDFNRLFLISLGIGPNQAIMDGIYQRCHNLTWERFPDTNIITQLPVPVGIISNWDESLELLLKKYFSNDFFRIISSSRIKSAKPDPAIFQAAIKDLDCEPQNILYIGDAIRLDVLPAEEVGIKVILIDRFDNYPYYNGHKINSLIEVKKLLHF